MVLLAALRIKIYIQFQQYPTIIYFYFILFYLCGQSVEILVATEVEWVIAGVPYGGWLPTIGAPGDSVCKLCHVVCSCVCMETELGGKRPIAWAADVMDQWIRHAVGIRGGLWYDFGGRIGIGDITF